MHWINKCEKSGANIPKIACNLCSTYTIFAKIACNVCSTYTKNCMQFVQQISIFAKIVCNRCKKYLFLQKLCAICAKNIYFCTLFWKNSGKHLFILCYFCTLFWKNSYFCILFSQKLKWKEKRQITIIPIDSCYTYIWYD